MSTDVILSEKRGSVAWITINRPEKRNAINGEVIAGIHYAIVGAQADSDIRAVVLTAAEDRAFCAGADLSTGTTTFGGDFAEPTLPFSNLLRTVRGFPLPIVARINGACIAGGMGLLAMCDLAIAADHARFGLPEVKVGVFPMQVLAVLQPILALRDLMELCICGEPVDAETAARMRLVNYVVPQEQLDERTAWLLGRIVDKSPTAIRRGKYAIAALEKMSFDQAVAFAETQIGVTALTADAAEGVAAFNERRAPRWTGR